MRDLVIAAFNDDLLQNNEEIEKDWNKSSFDWYVASEFFFK